jgi:hypothetical protein
MIASGVAIKDGLTASTSTIVIPAKAGIQLYFASVQSWTPASAGVTSDERGRERPN